MEEQEVREQPNYYAIIPASVRYDERLRDKTKLLYGEITALTNKTGECWASNEYFANLYQITTRSISSMITELEECGYIKRTLTYKENSKEVEKRIISIPIENYYYTYGKNLLGGIEKNFQDNNTSINNTRINNSSSSATSNLSDFIEQNFGRTLNTIEIQKILNWKDTELTRYAIEKAVLNNKYSIGYIDGILRNFEINRVKTIQEAQSLSEEYKNKKTYKKQIKEETPVPDWIKNGVPKKQEIIISDEERAFYGFDE